MECGSNGFQFELEPGRSKSHPPAESLAGVRRVTSAVRSDSPTIMKSLATSLALAVFLGPLGAVSSRAELVSFSAFHPAPVGSSQITDWSTTLTFPKFNPSLGFLNSITFRLAGTVSGLSQSENTSPSSGNDITLNLSAALQLFRPGSTDLANRLVVATPTDIRTFSAGTYDGVTDFAGSSGVTFVVPNTEKVNKFVSTSDADKALFSGLGTIDLPLTATGKSRATGGGSAISVFDTRARGDVTVTYHYSAVPEPRVYGAVGIVLCAALAAYRRRQMRVRS